MKTAAELDAEREVQDDMLQHRQNMQERTTIVRTVVGAAAAGGALMSDKRPVVTEIPGPGACCGAKTCQDCKKITPCREEHARPQRQQRAGD